MMGRVWVAALLMLVPACGKGPSPEAEASDAAALSTDEASTAHESPLRYRPPAPVRRFPDTLVESGRLPLAYLCDAGGAIRIVDVTGNRVLLQETVPPRTVIGVSEGGIVVGRRKALAGPLAGDREYQIWLEAPKR